ncbi:hypothetical protein TNCV_2855001 [Trichonephila clavipes]|nr:hypothetical protein TNCV_2855001 [Trichonephila clavipes]
MAHNKQLKVVLRGLPTDYNQEELMSELTTLGFKPNHISLLRNRKTNTNMPLFLVTLLRNPENKGNRDYTGMWGRLGSTDLMAGKVMFLRSNQGGRFDGNESVADSFRGDLVNFKSSCTTILGLFPSYVCQKKPPVGKRTRCPRSPSVTPILIR